MKLQKKVKHSEFNNNPIKRAAKTAGVSLNDFLNGSTEQARDLTGQLQNLSGIVREIGDSFNQVADASSRAFLAFDTAKTKVATLSNESNLYANQALKLTGELSNQVTSTEILTAQYEILSSGFSKAADASEIARVSVLGAKAGFTDVATVADATTSVLNAYGLAASDAANVVDQLAVVQDKGKTTIGQYAGVLGKVAPIAASAGVSLKELNAAVASVTINGVKTETAVSGIRQAIVNLIKPTDSAKEALESIGITNAASTLKTEGLVGVLNRLKDAGFKSSDQLSQIFTDIDGLTAVVPLLNDDLSNFNKNLLALDDASGKAQKGFDTVAASAEGKIATSVNKINEALVDLGRGVTTAFEPLATAIGNAASVFTSLPAPIKVLVGGLIGLTGAALTSTAALIALGAVAPAFVQGLALVTGGTTAATTAIAGLGITAGAVLAPLALLTAAVAGIQFARFANDVKGFNEELDNITAGTTAEGNAAFALATKIKNLNDQRKAGIEISKEQQNGFIKLADQEIELQKKRLAAINAIKPANDDQRNSQLAERAGIEVTIKALENQRKTLADNTVVTNAKTKANLANARSSEQITEAIKKRIDLEKRALEDSARIRGREFESQAKGASTNFETKARAEKQAFETKLNADKKAFEDSQKTDKEQFEKQLQTEQRSFNDGEKSKDRDFQKSKQDLERAFNQEQQKAKADFDKQQQESSRAFDARQNSEKTKAEGLFAQRRVEIERKLQLDAANTPEDRAKLEAEFKAADEKAALEKAAFAQLKADEEAFALKQQAEKVAFDDAQKLKDQEFQKAQQDQKITFDDAQKLKDLEFEKQKEATKLAFENTLKAKRDELEAAQTTTKLAFEEQIAIAKQEFEDAERTKKDAFETAQNLKKQQFEDSERIKKQTFEDNLKTLEAKFSAEERAKDIATAKQVAAIKNTSSATAKSGARLGLDISPRAKGGRFNAGQQLLVGERGQELVTFGNSGFVSTAADTKQILSSNTSAPSSVSTARMEALLTQLVGKLDRPNVSVQTSENPSDVYVKIQREAARAAAMNAGI
jgi:TP901 family phage tail tape measure protein